MLSFEMGRINLVKAACGTVGGRNQEELESLVQITLNKKNTPARSLGQSRSVAGRREPGTLDGSLTGGRQPTGVLLPQWPVASALTGRDATADHQVLQAGDCCGKHWLANLVERGNVRSRRLHLEPGSLNRIVKSTSLGPLLKTTSRLHKSCPPRNSPLPLGSPHGPRGVHPPKESSHARFSSPSLNFAHGLQLDSTSHPNMTM